jgi:hypothetical protein
MKTKKIELVVDLIGNEEPLTSSEENALSEFFKKKKEINKKKKNIKTRMNKKEMTES